MIKKSKFQRCRYCKGARFNIISNKKIGSEIVKEMCIYCQGRGWTIDNKEDLNTTNNNLGDK